MTESMRKHMRGLELRTVDVKKRIGRFESGECVLPPPWMFGSRSVGAMEKRKNRLEKREIC